MLRASLCALLLISSGIGPGCYDGLSEPDYSQEGVLGRLWASPNPVVFQPPSGTQTFDRNVYLANTGTERVRVENIELVGNPAFSFHQETIEVLYIGEYRDWVPRADCEQLAITGGRFSYDPLLDDASDAHLVIHVADPYNPTLKVPFLAIDGPASTQVGPYPVIKPNPIRLAYRRYEGEQQTIEVCVRLHDAPQGAKVALLAAIGADYLVQSVVDENGLEVPVPIEDVVIDDDIWTVTILHQPRSDEARDGELVLQFVNFDGSIATFRAPILASAGPG